MRSYGPRAQQALRRSLATLGVAALLIFAVLDSAVSQPRASLYPDTESLLLWRSRSGFHVHQYRIDDRDFHIPHISHLRISFGTLAQPSKQAAQVSLYLMLPDLRPLGPSSPEYYEGSGWGNMLALHIDDRGLMTPVDEMFRLNLDKKTVSSDPSALARMPDRYFGEWFYRVSAKSDVEFIAKCSINRPSNSCSARYYFNDRVLVTYTFAKSLLPGWAEIDRNVKTLVSSFFE